MKLHILSLGMAAAIACGVSLPGAAHADIYLGNGNSGFGGVIGTGSLELTSFGTLVNGSLTRGAGDLNDAGVIYLDSTSGGFASTVTFDDASDGLRRAISGFDGGANRSAVNFNAGFGADFAIAFDQGFGGLWQLQGTGAHLFVADLGLTPTGLPSSPTFDFSFDLSDIGLTPGGSFDFVATYLNSGNAFRSDEAIGDGILAGNPGQMAITFTGSRTFVTAIPEPSSATLVLAGGAWVAFRRRRKATLAA